MLFGMPFRNNDLCTADLSEIASRVQPLFITVLFCPQLTVNVQYQWVIKDQGGKCQQHAHVQSIAGQKAVDTQNTGTDRQHQHHRNVDGLVKSPKNADMSLRAKRGNLVTHRIT
jgi:hypothetical protein